VRLPHGLAALAACLLLAAPAATAQGRCDGTPRRGCLLPFPNDVAQTRPDRSSATGVRVALRRTDLPANSQGVHVATRELNRNDGFSPGQPIIVHVPSLRTQARFRASGIVPVTNMAAYRRPSQKLLLLDERTARRRLVWGELDANATTAAGRNLIVHPGRNLVPGRRYVVVLRGLRDRQPKGLPATWDRRVRSALRRAGVRPSRVYLAWRFTVASNRSLTGRLLRARDDAFRQLGDANLADGRIQGAPPRFAVTGSTDFTVAQNPLTARRVTGTFELPCYMTKPGCPPGARLHYSSTRPDALPTQLRSNVQRATFTCNIPRAALGAPSHIALYGHGLLGDQSEIDGDDVQRMGQEHDFTFCATDMYGMARGDIPTAIAALKDLSRFSVFVDRQLQGVLAQLYLGRLLAHPRGLVTSPAFAGLIDVAGPLSWDSNSQGGIFGGTITALAPDWRRAVLGVPAIGYGVLLLRSTDFATYRTILDPAYPDRGQQTLLLSLIQMLWDRTETNGWTQYVTNRPPPNSPRHAVLMHVAVGDHQVANVQSDTEARSIGASIYRPSVARGRTTDRRPSYGLPAIRSFPFRGSAVVWWDGGPQSPPVPTTNTPPTAGADPHSFPRKTVAARSQKATFLLGGGIVDVCGGRPCRSDNFR
jgi:hypothetical protein